MQLCLKRKIAITDLALRTGLHCEGFAALTSTLSWGLKWAQFFATVM